MIVSRMCNPVETITCAAMTALNGSTEPFASTYIQTPRHHANVAVRLAAHAAARQRSNGMRR